MLEANLSTPPRIHDTAVIDEQAYLGDSVVVGAYAVIGPNVRIGDGSRIGPHVVIERDTQIGRDCQLHAGAVIGGDPQDLKYTGEQSDLVIGDRTIIRECVTINRGTAARGRTEVGSDCLIMAYAHVAHDCVICDHVILSNAVNMGGHCTLGEWAAVGGLTAIHQFAQIGRHAFVGGLSAVRKDVPPFVKASGNPLRLFGLNSVGLERRGFSLAQRAELRRAYRLLFQSKENLREASARVRAELGESPVVVDLLAFIDASTRGITI
jgi:UDP-N-acetylglucosamine acyltransferase